ncbi:GIY-YIG nuclease family protein [Emcibacter sp. SYSU 3D8]|uniref:GIY-YIG nuclease family protein n=1 Tax=Emcibacter sp. SYSU 3D8 TaxID=3133969 RepID=UPI0031FEF614
MNLNDLLASEGIDPSQVIVMRHRPQEPELNKVLPWLAAEKPDTFNAYQQTQGTAAENAMRQLQGKGYIASFIRHAPTKALFVGVYKIGATTPLTPEQYWSVPAYQEMKAFGMYGFSENDGREHVLWFDLALTDFYADWKGKLIVGWPPPERSWWRRSHRNVMPVLAVLEQSALDAAMPEWDQIDLSWEELAVLPMRWQDILRQWRGIYLIFDQSDGKSYVGSAYGSSNLLGRWLSYAASGHGGNRLLRQRDPRNFRFTILQRASPDLEAEEVIRLEGTWKERLHTRAPWGLNDN